MVNTKNPLFYPDCQCDGNRFRRDCSLDNRGFQQYIRMSGEICSALYRASPAEDASADVLLNRAQLLSSILIEPAQIDIAATARML